MHFGEKVYSHAEFEILDDKKYRILIFLILDEK